MSDLALIIHTKTARSSTISRVRIMFGAINVLANDEHMLLFENYAKWAIWM